jgi:hypothetical protein
MVAVLIACFLAMSFSSSLSSASTSDRALAMADCSALVGRAIGNKLNPDLLIDARLVVCFPAI